MTIGITTTFVRAPGNGVTTVVNFPFKAFSASDLIVRDILDSTGTPTTLTLNTHYTVSLSTLDEGGSVTFLSALVSGHTYDIRSSIAPTQGEDIRNQGRFLPSIHEGVFDKAVRLIQDLSRKVAQSIQAPDYEASPPSFTLPNAVQRALNYLAFDASGNAVVTSGTGGGDASLRTDLANTTTAGKGNDMVSYRRTAAEIAAGVTPVNYAYLELDPHRYNVDVTGAANTAAAFANLIAVAQQYTGVTLRMPQNGKYRFDTGITWDVSKVGVDWQGSTLDFSHMTTGHAYAPTNSNGNANIRGLVAGIHPFSNAYLIGPGVATTAVDGIYLNDTVNANAMANLRFHNVSMQDFATDVTFGANAFCCSFDGGLYTQLSGAGTQYSVVQQNATNSGERNTFTNCQWFNKPFCISDVSSTGGNMMFTNCSFDYFIRAFNVTLGCTIFVMGGHIESNTDTDNWGYVTSGSSALVIIGTQMSLTGAKTAFDMFWSDPTTTNGGVFLLYCKLGCGANAFTKELVGGGGNCKHDTVIQDNAGAHPTLSPYASLLAYGTFESASYANDWTFTGTTPPVRSGAQFHAGAFSLSFPYTAGNPNTQATAIRACRPGQYLQGEFWYLTPGIGGSNYQLLCQVDFLDAAGVSIGSTVILSQTASLAVWTRAGIKTLAPAPTGTVNVRLLFAGFGNGAGTQTGFIDDVIAGIQ